MKSLIPSLIVLSLAALGCSTPTPPEPTPPGQPRMVSSGSDPLASAMAELMATLRDVETEIRNAPAYGDEQERIGGYRHILRSIAKGLEAEVRQDPDYPYFRILDWWLREGGDNPDQRYAFTPIRGARPTASGATSARPRGWSSRSTPGVPGTARGRVPAT